VTPHHPAVTDIHCIDPYPEALCCEQAEAACRLWCREAGQVRLDKRSGRFTGKCADLLHQLTQPAAAAAAAAISCPLQQ
jgi:hypothetical protein